MATEVKIPDIGDYKDVPIVEVHVKRGISQCGRSSRLAGIRQGHHGGTGALRRDCRETADQAG